MTPPNTHIQIHIPDCGHGWRPTQHVMLRVLKGAGVFESHPFTITNAPSSTLTAKGITLYAKVSGDWTRRLHAMASDVAGIEVGEDVEERESFLEKTKRGEEVDVADHPGKKVLVTLDGPYGGLKMDLGDYGRVMVVAGGSGVTFALGAVEEAICRKRQGRGQGPDQVLVVWVVRDMCKSLRRDSTSNPSDTQPLSRRSRRRSSTCIAKQRPITSTSPTACTSRSPPRRYLASLPRSRLSPL